MKYIIYFCAIFFLLFTKTFAINSQVENIYENFSEKIERSYSLGEQKEIFETVHDTAQTYYWDKKYSAKREIFSDLLALNNERLFTLWKEEFFSQTEQKIRELRYRKNLSNNLKNISHPSYIASLLNRGNISFISTNEQREFIENSEIQRVEYTRYSPITSSSVGAFKSKKGIILYEDGEYRFVEDYSFTRKIPYGELAEIGYTLLSDDKKFSQKNTSYYGYNFTNFKYFPDGYGIFETQLQKENFSPENTLMYQDSQGHYNFVTQYDESYLGDENIFFGVSQKQDFLNNLADDMRYATQNPENILGNIQSISHDLLKISDSQGDYREKVYNYILENISYSENINLENTEIFSGLETFVRGDGVCTGYTKLTAYMLRYGNISDVEVIRGYVIDAQDFPQIGHAWLRIGDAYYDPTFDDPVGFQRVKRRDEYMYFGLPKDIFYANRYTYDELPLGLKTASNSEISLHIYDRLKRLIPKYEGQLKNYNVFGPVVFRETYNIGQNTLITAEILTDTIGSYSIENNSFRFMENGNTRQITSFRYFKLDNENTEQILGQLAYDVEDLYLFDWETESGTREWRLAYEIELR